MLGGGGNPLPLLLNFPQQSSSGSSVLGASVERNLPPGASLLIQTAEGPSLPVATGSAQIYGNSPLSGFAIFRRVSDAQEAVVPIETRNASSYLLVFDNTNGLSLGVAVANISTQTANVGVVIRDDSGGQIGSGSISILGSGQKSFLLADPNWFPATANRRGTIEFDTPPGGQISVLGIRLSPPANSLTTVPPLANVGTGGGNFAYLASGEGWKTTIVLVNAGATPALSHLKFFDRDGNPWSLPISFPQSGGSASPAISVDQTLVAGATLLIESTGSLTDPLLTGSAQLATDGSVSGFVIFRHLTNGQEAVVPIETRKAGAYLLAFDNTGGTFTGVAMSSVSATPMNIPVVIRDDTGTQIGAETIALPANGLVAFYNKYPEVVGVRGTMEFNPPVAGTISVLGIRLPLSGTLTTLPAFVK